MDGTTNKYFITGATGYIGSRLAIRLAKEGNTVHAIIRSPGKAGDLQDPNIKLFTGDITDEDLIRNAMEGCDHAFHLAAFAKPWSRDPGLPYRINVELTAKLLDLAKELGLKKFIFTSSAATIEPSGENNLSDESTPRRTAYFNQYDSTKAAAEEVVGKANGNGFEALTVNPSRVYGPGPLSVSNAMTRIMVKYMNGRWRIIPGSGKVVGNYVFVDDVVDGHIRAAYHGGGGERYILGGENLTFDQVFSIIARVTGKKHKLFHFPVSLMTASVWLIFNGSRLVGAAPFITPGWVKKYMHHAGLSSRKAEQELGYSATSFEEGTARTISWIKKMKL